MGLKTREQYRESLNDGRVVYTRWEYVDRAACPIQSLWAINPDGTGLTGFYGNRPPSLAAASRGLSSQCERIRFGPFTSSTSGTAMSEATV